MITNGSGEHVGAGPACAMVHMWVRSDSAGSSPGWALPAPGPMTSTSSVACWFQTGVSHPSPSAGDQYVLSGLSGLTTNAPLM